MKSLKFLCIALIILSTLLLFGCSDGPYKFDQSTDQICKIEIVYLEEENAIDNYSLILEIEPDQYQEFISDFLEMEWYPLHPPGTDIAGLCIKFTYTNDEFELVYNMGRYRSRTNSITANTHLETDVWRAFLRKYGVEWSGGYHGEIWSYIE